MMTHQYIQRAGGRVMTEPLIADRTVNMIYSPLRERAPSVFKLLTSQCMSSFLAWFCYDIPFQGNAKGVAKVALDMGIDLEECMDLQEVCRSRRHLFERRIKYWEKRPMPEKDSVIVSPADSRMIAGSFERDSALFLKEKFFSFYELLGFDRTRWLDVFSKSDYAVFRLTPDKYHYNHFPVSGQVSDIYEIDGPVHSCNPGAVTAGVNLYSKNRRVVTVINTDTEGGARVGYVAMIEVTAMMIGDVVQCYSEKRYDEPVQVTAGLRVRKGQPKSLYRPGSSVDVLLFQKGRVRFDEDIITNLHRTDVQSRYSEFFGRPLVETDVRVREGIGVRV